MIALVVFFFLNKYFFIFYQRSQIAGANRCSVQVWLAAWASMRWFRHHADCSWKLVFFFFFLTLSFFEEVRLRLYTFQDVSQQATKALLGSAAVRARSFSSLPLCVTQSGRKRKSPFCSHVGKHSGVTHSSAGDICEAYKQAGQKHRGVFE